MCTLKTKYVSSVWYYVPVASSLLHRNFFLWLERENKSAEGGGGGFGLCVCVFEGGDGGLAEWPFPLPPVGSVVFSLQCSVAPITNLISHGHPYTQKFIIPHDICILFGDAYKHHYILIVIKIMIIFVISNRSFSVTLSAALQIAWNKRKF